MHHQSHSQWVKIVWHHQSHSHRHLSGTTNQINSQWHLSGPTFYLTLAPPISFSVTLFTTLTLALPFWTFDRIDTLTPVWSCRLYISHLCRSMNRHSFIGCIFVIWALYIFLKRSMVFEGKYRVPNMESGQYPSCLSLFLCDPPESRSTLANDQKGQQELGQGHLSLLTATLKFCQALQWCFFFLSHRGFFIAKVGHLSLNRPNKFSLYNVQH